MISLTFQSSLPGNTWRIVASHPRVCEGALSITNPFAWYLRLSDNPCNVGLYEPMGYQLLLCKMCCASLTNSTPSANKAQSLAHACYSIACVPYIIQPMVFLLALFCREDSNSCSVVREFVCRAPSTSLALEAMQRSR